MDPEKISEVLIGKTLEVLLESFLKKEKKDINNDLDYEKVFSNYLDKKYRKLNLINSIVLKNRHIFLDDIFIPLTLYAGDLEEQYKITEYPKTLVEKYGLILITDTAGMGKSTLLKKIFISSIFENQGIPIFIELRRIKENESILDEIIKELDLTKKDNLERALSYLFEAGNFIFYFDGFDEIPNENKSHVTLELQKFVSKYFKGNYFFLTSRPELALSSFNEFKEFRIKKLELSESFDLIKKYDNTNIIANLLIEKLKENEMQSIHEFLVNPLLTSLLFLAFEFKQKIPLKKHLFYRQVYDANFENHDLTKGDSFSRNKYSKLQSDDFHRVLRHIGFECMKLQKIEFEKDKLLQLISNSKKFYSDLQFKDTDFLKDLILTVPLFNRDGNYYRWSHKSIQEYFSAQFIYKDAKVQQEKVLEQIYNHDNIDYFINTLDLYYDIDYKTFRSVIEYKFLLEFHEYQSEMLKFYDESFNLEDFNKRITLTFLKKVFIVQDSREELVDESVYSAEREKFRKRKKNDRHRISYLELADKLMNRLLDTRSLTKSNDIKKNKYENTGVLTFPRYGLNTYLSILNNKKLIILNLLYNKGKSYVIFYNRSIDDYVKILINKKEQDIVTEINMNVNNPFNRGDNFKLTNELIVLNINYFIDNDKAKKELENIRQNRNNVGASLYDF